MTGRTRLPDRRAAETVDLTLGAFTWRISPGYHRDGTLGEIFIEVDKSGTELAHLAHDGAVAASLALQYGCPVDVLKSAFIADENGAAAGLLGKAIAAVPERGPVLAAPDVAAWKFARLVGRIREPRRGAAWPPAALPGRLSDWTIAFITFLVLAALGLAAAVVSVGVTYSVAVP